MQTLFMVFMIFVTVTCLFAVLVVLRDVVKEIATTKRLKCENQINEVQSAKQEKEVEKVEKVVVEQKETPVTEVLVEEVAAAEVQAGNVHFSAGEKLTLSEKYAKLSKKEKARYDEIVNYAKQASSVRCVKNDRYEEYKVGKNRIVRMLIKRGVIVCEFILQNSDFRNFVNENKIAVKQSATSIKIVDESSVSVAKSSIDIAINAINEEKEYKKQLAREKRRERNKK